MPRARGALPGLLLLCATVIGCSGEPGAGAARPTDTSASGMPAPAASAAPAQPDTAAAAAVVAAMHRIYGGLQTQDTSAVNAAVSTAGMVYMDHHGIVPLANPEGTAYMVGLCRIRSYAMDSVRTSSPAPGLMLLSFKLAIDETCGERRTPSPVYALSTWHQQDGAWKLAAFAGAPADGAR